MNRQQRRLATQRAEKHRFPFPEHQGWLRVFLKKNPECFAQYRDGKYVTNMSGETETLSLEEFRELLDATKVGFENEQARDRVQTP